MTISEYIATNNLEGVQRYAAAQKLPLPNNPREAYQLLTMIKNKIGEAQYADIASQLHPDNFLFIQKDIQPISKKEFNNMSDCGCMKNATGDGANFSSEIQNIASQGIAATETALNTVVERTRQALRERNDDLTKNLLFFAAGIIVAKLLLK